MGYGTHAREDSCPVSIAHYDEWELKERMHMSEVSPSSASLVGAQS